MASFIDRTLVRLLTANCFVCAILGIVAIVFGILTEVKYGDMLGTVSYDDISTQANFFAAAPALLITGGALIFMVSVCGCWGIKGENIFLLKIYQTALYVSLVFCFILAIMTFAFASSLEYIFMSTLEIMFQTYDTTRETIDYFQRSGKCCGVQTFLYWSKDANWLSATSQMSLNGSSALPPSCCIDPNDVVIEVNVCDTGSLHYQDGCGKLIWMMFRENSELLEWLVLGIAATVIIGAILSTCILRRIYDEDSDSIGEATMARSAMITEPTPGQTMPKGHPVTMGGPLPNL